MNKLKTLVALVLAVMMVVGTMGLAMAQTYPANATQQTGKGSITIENAAKGETYGIVKLFDATLINDATASSDSTGIAYKGNIPAALTDYFVKDEAGNIHVATHGDPAAEWTEAEIIAAVQGWAATQTALAETVSDGSALTFANLDYGYYAVKTTQGAIITIDSTKPTVSVYDKNPTEPTANKEVNPDHGSIGQTVTYTATFNTANYLKNETSGKPEQVVSYIIEDTLPSFLTDVAITSVKVVETPGSEAVGTEGEEGYKPAVAEVATDLSASYTEFTNKKIEIPWVVESVPTENHEYTSKYKNGADIVIVYTAKITSEAAVGAGNVNKVSLKPQVDRGSGKVPYSDQDKWNDTATIYTHAAALQKKAGSANGDNLPGAEFKFAGLIVTGQPGFYTVVSYTPSGTNGTTMKCDSNGKLVIAGIDADSTTPVKLVGTETKAPDGYNKLAGTFELTTTVMAASTTTTWGQKTTHYDADGNIVDTQTTGGSDTTRTEITSITDLPAASIQPVVNNKGTELPSTGGIGTTIFYVAGIVLVLGAAAIIIARRKAEQN